jgi:hypothetical protein
MKSQKQKKKKFNICGNHTYLIKIKRKTIWRGDFKPKLTLKWLGYLTIKIIYKWQ